MITIVDYGMGNLGSLLNMFKRLGVNASIESDPVVIGQAKKLILPGVGAFDAAMMRINSLSGLREILEYKARVEKVPILGVCLGMQLLGIYGSEDGGANGLGLLPMRIDLLANSERSNLPLPHVGFNSVRFSDQVGLFSGLPQDGDFYFVHSYAAHEVGIVDRMGQTTYGETFVSALELGNICGTQFHPEKSQSNGLLLLRNFFNKS